MIYFILILFFVSFAAMVFMVGRKLVLLKNGQTSVQEGETSFEIPYLKETKNLIVENIKKYEHLGLVATVKSYLQLTNFLKNKYEEVKINITNKFHKNKKILESDVPGNPEASKFLKMISDYKHRIKEIKHKIHEEENGS